MSPRIRISSLAVSAVLGLSVFAAAPAGATEDTDVAPVCTLSEAGIKAAQDEIALIKAQLKGTRPSKAQRLAIVEAIRALESAARGGETNRSRKRKGDARKELRAALRGERNAGTRTILRAQLKALNESLEAGRVSKGEKALLRAKRAELVALLKGRPDRATRKALQQRRSELNRLLEPCVPDDDAPVVQPPTEPVVEQPPAEEPAAEQPAAEEPVAETPSE